MTMVFKSLNFNKRILEDNFNPYIFETVNEAMNVTKTMLEQIPPDCMEVNYVTYSNLLQAMTFDIHPSTAKDNHYSALLKLDQTPFELLLENIFVRISQHGD